MESYERIDARGVRETGRPVSFVPSPANKNQVHFSEN